MTACSLCPDRIDEIFSLVQSIRDTEHQANQIRSGTTPRERLHFDEYLEKRDINPGLGLREHQLPRRGNRGPSS
jgi:hypothetical protein